MDINLRTNFQSVSGSEQQSVDEIMVGFKGYKYLEAMHVS